MKRLFFLSSSLDTVATAEQSLLESGIKESQMHVYSDSEAEAEIKHLHPVSSLERTDIVHWMERGAFIGMGAVIAFAAVYYASGAAEKVTWAPFLVGSIMLFGFCCWEAGLFGLQRVNYKFSRFREDLKKGKHVLYVDVNDTEMREVKLICTQHAQMAFAGSGSSITNPFVSREN